LLKRHGQSRYVDHVEGRGLEMFTGALVLGLEGAVGKDGKSPYIEGPRETWHWLKIKNADYKRQGKVEFRQSRARK